jgi:hypothetical protein
MTTPQPGDPIGPAIRRARQADLRVTTSFEQEFRGLAVGGLARSGGDTKAVQRAADTLMTESIRIAQEANDPALEPEHLHRAQSSLCPLWPIC